MVTRVVGLLYGSPRKVVRWRRMASGASVLIAVLVLLTACHAAEPRGQHGVAPAEQPAKAEAAPSAASTEDVPAAGDQAVLVHLRLSNDKFGTADEVTDCQALEEQLEQEIARVGVGEMDGNEIGEGECVLFMYGPNADKLFTAIEQLVKSSSFAKGAWALKRYGSPEDPHAREVRVEL